MSLVDWVTLCLFSQNLHLWIVYLKGKITLAAAIAVTISLSNPGYQFLTGAEIRLSAFFHLILTNRLKIPGRPIKYY